ncbi:MAG: DUF2279 domain-containing protein [Candidatus Latescibacterota bacterium]
MAPQHPGLAPRVPEGRRLRPRRLALLGATAAGLHYLGFRYFDHSWYEDQTRLDRIRWVYDWDGDTYLNMDKGGHFMGGLIMAQSLSGALAWSGLGPRAAALLGTAASWGAMLEIEMRDSHYAAWGFSVPDFTANTLGATVPLLHALVPATQAVTFKFSYHPSDLYLDRESRRLQGRPHTDHIIDDYEGMAYWMALALEEVLPASLARDWPNFLGLALGYGATGLHGSNVKSKGPEREHKEWPPARPEVFLALDYNARRLPGSGGVWSFVRERLNWIHFPAPTVRLYPSWRFYLLYL